MLRGVPNDAVHEAKRDHPARVEPVRDKGQRAASRPFLGSVLFVALAPLFLILGHQPLFAAQQASTSGNITADPVRSTDEALAVPAVCLQEALGTSLGPRPVPPGPSPTASPSASARVVILGDLFYRPRWLSVPAESPITVTLIN